MAPWPTRARTRRAAPPSAATSASTSSREQRAQAPRDPEHQAEVRRALRTLGLPEDATDDEIKRAWREQALRHHPDRHASESESPLREEDHAEAFLRAQRAYETLTDRDGR
ncbi:MAG: hypothetical protein BRD48_06250 [Bacteroidetes bacterium QS_9_68_14]|nr:MAG: hypothetical protein BRD48_06250 [Bacteroidetes bacterium QS_9_68_14]